eukprot:ctg_698.g342
MQERFESVPRGSVTTPEGFVAAGMSAGLKPSGAPDLAAVYSSEVVAAAAAGVFTQSQFAAAPVLWCREQLERSSGRARAVLINAGQANAATGDAGHRDAVMLSQRLAALLRVPEEQVLVASTGVIGRRIDCGRVEAALPQLTRALQDSSAGAARAEGGLQAARAMMTTDLVPKHTAATATIQGRRVSVGVMAKGSGMIHPDMATLLAFVTTDAVVEPQQWARYLRAAADVSFNQITVDGDTSTNDTLIGFANGASGVSIPDDEQSEVHRTFQAMLTHGLQHAAKAIARDGEGATVLLEVRVQGTASDAEARRLARTVARSNLFKAAVYGRDPNWGRIAAALGYSGVCLSPAAVDIALGPHVLMRSGQPVPFDARAASDYIQSAADAGRSPDTYLTEADTVSVDIRVGSGDGSGVAWGCDLSYDYVRINAEYTT